MSTVAPSLWSLQGGIAPQQPCSRADMVKEDLFPGLPTCRFRHLVKSFLTARGAGCPPIPIRPFNSTLTKSKPLYGCMVLSGTAGPLK